MFGGGDCLGFVACQQMATNSPYVRELNAGDDTIGDVRYTSIYTVYDELATPYSTSRMDDGATRILIEFEPDAVSVDRVRGVLRAGPPESSA